MSLFKRVQNILEEDRKAYFSSKQTDLYEKVIKKKLSQTASKQGRNILTKIANTPFGRYIKKKYKKLVKNKKTEIPKTETPKTEIPKTENIKRPNVKNKKYRNEDGSFNQKLYDKDKIDYKKSFIENPKVNPKPDPKVDPKVDPPKTNPFKDFLKKIEPGKLTRTAIKTAGGLGAVGIVANKVLDNTKTKTELDKIKKQNKKLTTTSNGNNKLIPIDPNNKDAATTTTKKLYPVKLKFGLGSGK